VNTDAPWPSLVEAKSRVLEIQTKLHRWATDDETRRFNDLHNLVCDPGFLAVAWARVKGNRGARTAGVDGVTPRDLAPDEQRFLIELRAQLKSGEFSPLPVRERRIPKRNGKLRSLGIPNAADRTVQAALKLVLEPIFEADFEPCSHGFRPGRRAHDAIAEARHFAAHGYRWVVEGDIEACFDRIDHPALMDRVRQRIGDKRVLGLVKAFLKAGILTKEGPRSTDAGTPQGGVLSPLLANIALSVLDEHFTAFWTVEAATRQQRLKRRRHGLPNYRLVRYADDFVVLVHGEQQDAERICDTIADVIAPMGLNLSEAKTSITHIDEGFDFLGYRIQRHQKRGTNKRFVYTYPSKTALAAIKRKVKAMSRTGRNRPLRDLLRRLNLVLQGSTNYFRHGAAKATFGYLRAYVWQRVVLWLRRKHPHANWKQLRRRHLPGWWPTDGDMTLFDPNRVPVRYYRYRGTTIPAPWPKEATPSTG
jgi:RNA-directed DNA polymerase